MLTQSLLRDAAVGLAIGLGVTGCSSVPPREDVVPVPILTEAQLATCKFERIRQLDRTVSKNNATEEEARRALAVFARERGADALIDVQLTPIPTTRVPFTVTRVRPGEQPPPPPPPTTSSTERNEGMRATGIAVRYTSPECPRSDAEVKPR